MYTYSIQHRVKAIYFENVSATKLREFKAVITCLRQVPGLISIFASHKETLRSQRLKQLISHDTDGGLLPLSMMEEIEELEKMLIWKKNGTDESSTDEIPEPQPGLDP